MFKRLAVAILIVIAAEILGIIIMSHWIGGWPTFGLLLAAAFGGAWLARREGRRVMADVRRHLQAGQPPGFALLDGLCVMAGGLLLILPGFLTDIVGITLLFPPTRTFYRLLLYRWLERKFRTGSFTFRRGPFA